VGAVFGSGKRIAVDFACGLKIGCSETVTKDSAVLGERPAVRAATLPVTLPASETVLDELVQPAPNRLLLHRGETAASEDFLDRLQLVGEQLEDLLPSGPFRRRSDGAERAPASLAELDGDLIRGAGEPRDKLHHPGALRQPGRLWCTLDLDDHVRGANQRRPAADAQPERALLFPLVGDQDHADAEVEQLVEGVDRLPDNAGVGLAAASIEVGELVQGVDDDQADLRMLPAEVGDRLDGLRPLATS